MKEPERKSSMTMLLLLLAIFLVGCQARGNTVWSVSNAERVFQLSAEADRAYVESRWIDAARNYQQLAVLVPQDPYAWFRLGNTFAKQGAYEQAIEAYRTSIDRNSQQPKPWYNLATAHLLKAEYALVSSYDRLRPGDPARDMIKQQLKQLHSIIYQRVEDISPPANGLALR